MSIDENDINWVKDGEDASAEVLNRPSKELLSKINSELDSIPTFTLEQSTGDSTTNPMSQKAVTDAISENYSSLSENIKVTVGSGGDFPTINAAILHLSRFTPDLGVTAEVELRAGFVMSEQLLLNGLNLGWITITGVDAETIIDEPSLTDNLTFNVKPAFGVKNGGTLPVIGQLFIFSNKGSTSSFRCGVVAAGGGSSAEILPGCGVKNAGRYGIYALEGSTINARSAVASGAGGVGIYAERSSTINATGADASGVDGDGICAIEGSTINATGADASGAVGDGICAYRGSTINARSAVASGAGGVGIYVVEGSTINAHNATGTLSQTKNTITSNGIIFQP